MKKFKFEITKIGELSDWRHDINVIASSLLEACSKVREIYPESEYKAKYINE